MGNENISSKQITVLCIDDEPDVLKPITSFLSGRGLRVISYAHLEGVRQVLENESVDIVLTDIRGIDTPTYDFKEFVRDCTARGIPIIVHVIVSLEVPAGVTYLNKSLSDPPFILEIIQRVLKNKTAVDRISDEALHQLANPQWHLMSPEIKWMIKIFENPKSSREERVFAVLTLEQRALEGMIREAVRQGSYRQRELNEMMDKYLQIKRKLDVLRVFEPQFKRHFAKKQPLKA